MHRITRPGPSDLENGVGNGQYSFDRKKAIERGTGKLAFFAELFPEIDSFEAIADKLLERLTKCKSKTIGFDAERSIQSPATC
jgi:hypothetical protein